MKSTNRVFCAFAALAFSIGIYAQSGTNSPYSQYGLGVLSDQTSGFNRGMNGVGLGFREHNQVNFINPASYSAVDSLSFIFDVGFSGHVHQLMRLPRKFNPNPGKHLIKHFIPEIDPRLRTSPRRIRRPDDTFHPRTKLRQGGQLASIDTNDVRSVKRTELRKILRLGQIKLT